MILERTMASRLIKLARKFPVVTVTGPRQSGKTTLVHGVFKDYKYVSLENPDVREFAMSDPRLFLSRHTPPVILDEVQRVPGLLSYIQTIVDESGRDGMYILTGSNNLMLLENVSQSLAGRTALLNLLPFSFEEIASGHLKSVSLEETLFTGSYPRIYAKGLRPDEFYGNYIATYVERDVRRIIKVTDLDKFQRFLKMCAARCGQLINLSSLGNDCGINHSTAKAWLSLLETCYIIYQLQPHFENLGKRLMKSPKLYFLDTGLLCYLLGIQKHDELVSHPMRGHIFETWVLNELLKSRFNSGLRSNLYFWRDHVGHEVDCIIDNGSALKAIEVKSGTTLAEDHFEGLNYFKKLAKEKAAQTWLIYAGADSHQRSAGNVADWRSFGLKTVHSLTAM